MTANIVERTAVRSLAVLFVVLPLLSAAGPSFMSPAAGTGTTWAKVFGGYENATGIDVLPTADGGYLVLGEIRPKPVNGTIDINIWLLKLSATGAIEWQYIYGGPGRERPYHVRQTSDGGYVVVAMTTSFGAVGVDAWVLKLDALGGIQWQKAYGPAAYDIQQTSDGGYIMVGQTTYFPGYDYFSSVDAWVVKLDSVGNVVWEKAYGTTSPSSSQHECANSVQQTSDGGYIVAGTMSLWQPGGWVPSTWLFKIDSVGTLSWQKTYGAGSGGRLCAEVMSMNPDVLVTADGGYFVDPVYFYGPEATDGYAMKVDSTGKVLWRKAYGSAASEYFKSAEAMPDGGFVLAGDGFGGPWVVRLDSAGNLVWQKRYGMSGTHPAYGMAARAVSDGGIILTGYWAGLMYPYEPAPGLIVMKLDGDGNPGVCTDPTIGVNTDAVQRNSSVKASASKAKVATPTTTAMDTAATPLPSNAQESQLCTG